MFKRTAYWLLAIGVAIVLLRYSLRGISWPGVAHLVSRAAPQLLILAVLLASVSLFVRALRWRLLLQTAGNVQVSTAFAAISAGYCGNLLLPARAGELIRTLMIHRATGLSKAFVLTTAVCERLSDAVALLLVGALTLLTLPSRPGWFAHATLPFSIAAALGVAVIAFLPTLEPRLRPLLGKIPLLKRFEPATQNMAAHVANGFRTLHAPRVLLFLIAFTAVAWTADAVTILLLLRSLSLPGTLSLAFLLIAALGLGSAIPATPGYIGVYQFVAVSVLVPFGFSKTDAIAFILFFQALTYIVIPLWAALGALIAHTDFSLRPGTVAAALKERSA